VTSVAVAGGAEQWSAVAWTWGTTPAERELAFPCDRHLPGTSEALFRAVDVNASPGVVFRWLCQLRVAPYSYDWIDNFGRSSPRELTPGLDALAVGQRAMGFFTLVEFERDGHLTFLARSGPLGDWAVTYRVLARGERGARLVVKLVVRYPDGLVGWVLRRVAPWADLVMMRKQLLTLAGLAEAGEASRARELPRR